MEGKPLASDLQAGNPLCPPPIAPTGRTVVTSDPDGSGGEVVTLQDASVRVLPWGHLSCRKGRQETRYAAEVIRRVHLKRVTMAALQLDERLGCHGCGEESSPVGQRD